MLSGNVNCASSPPTSVAPTPTPSATSGPPAPHRATSAIEIPTRSAKPTFSWTRNFSRSSFVIEGPTISGHPSVEPPLDVFVDDVLELRFQQLLGFFEGVCQVVHPVGTIVLVVLHRAVGRRVHSVEHVLDECPRCRRCVRVGFEHGFEVLGLLFGVVLVRRPL